MSVELTPEAMDFIAEEAYEPAFGARPLKRYLQKNVETLLAKRILQGNITVGETLCIDRKDGKLSFTD